MSWFKGVMATIITGVVTWWLTEGIPFVRPEHKSLPLPSNSTYPSRPNSNVIGRYSGILNLELSAKSGKFFHRMPIVVSVDRPDGDGKFSGRLLQNPQSQQQDDAAISGIVDGNSISFERYVEGEVLRFYGALSGNILRGNCSLSGVTIQKERPNSGISAINCVSIELTKDR
jgi:hypothetical protein